MDVDVRVGQRMEIVGGVARPVENGEVIREFEIQELPQTFVQWQLDYKRGVYDAIDKDEYIAFNAGHLPVVATLNDEGLIPNLANKGIGFTPKDEHIEHYVKTIGNISRTIGNMSRGLGVTEHLHYPTLAPQLRACAAVAQGALGRGTRALAGPRDHAVSAAAAPRPRVAPPGHTSGGAAAETRGRRTDERRRGGRARPTR